MSKLARLGSTTLEDIGFNQWGERQPIVTNVDTELVQTQQAFTDVGISGQKIESLSVSKLTAGVLRVDTSIQSSNYVPGVAGFFMESATGSAEFRSGIIGGFTIGATTLTASDLIIDAANQFITIGGVNKITIDGATGTIYSQGSAWTLNAGGTSSGLAKISTVVTDVTVSNTTTETDFFSVTIPANTLSTNNAVKTMLCITGINIANTSFFTLRLKYAGSTIASTTIQNNSGSAFTGNAGIINTMLMGAGTTSSQEGSIYVSIGDGSVHLESTNTLSVSFAGVGTGTVTSTVDEPLVVSVQWNVASAANSITFSNAIIEKIT